MDAHYINKVLAGNTNAFGYFIRTYQNKAFAVAISIVKHEDSAKDVVQDSFITAYDSLSSFRKDAKFSTWLYRIVVNTALQSVKREKRKNRIVIACAINDIDKNTINGAIEKLQTQDLKRLVKRVFARIPAKEALILQLFYIDDQRISEIEAITSFTRSNIKVLLHRGRVSFYSVLQTENIKKPY